MNIFILLTLWIFSLNVTNVQNAEELNLLSKELLSKNEYQKALPVLRKSAELGNAETQYNLGYFLQSGVGISKDEKEAFEWYKKSSDNGFNDGHYAMMMAYGNGIGTEVNSEKAFEYAMKCANNNDATCMWNIVNCYKQGLGTQKDTVKMLFWAHKLAFLNHQDDLSVNGKITSTRLSLAKMYREGDCIKQNNYKSYIWYIIYNETKKDFSVAQQNKVIKEIIKLETELSLEQKNNAKKDAEILLGSKILNFENLHKSDF